jgi:hypothetical protein
MCVVRAGEDDGELRPWHYIYVYSIESRLIMRVKIYVCIIESRLIMTVKIDVYSIESRQIMRVRYDRASARAA